MAESVPILLKPVEAARVLSVGRTTVFALIKSGELESVLLSPRKRLIPLDACEAYVQRQRQSAA